MCPFFFASLLITIASLVFAPQLDARGGKGGGRGRGNSGGGNGGGSKWNAQASHPHGGGQRADTHGHKPAHGGDKHQLADKLPKPEKDHKPEKDKEKHDKYARPTSTNDPINPTTDAYNKKQKQLAIEQRNRDKRIAQAQHLREIGERNGNQNLIDNADRMEAFAHDHYASRVSHLEKFGVTDPLLNPGTGVNDPLLPGTDRTVDALSDLGVFDLLPLLP